MKTLFANLAIGGCILLSATYVQADTVSVGPAPYYTHFIDNNGPNSTGYHVFVGVNNIPNSLTNYQKGCSEAPDAQFAQFLPSRTVTLDSGFIEFSVLDATGVTVDIWDSSISIGEICAQAALGIFTPRWTGTLTLNSYDNNLTYLTGLRNGFGFIAKGTGIDSTNNSNVTFDIRYHNVSSPPNGNKAQDSVYEEVVITPVAN